MGKSCVLCKSNSDKRPELMFHRFPKDEILRQKWMQNMGIKKISKHTTICSIHFKEECFRSSIVSQKPILIRGSIPTIFTEEELLEQETVQDDNSSDSLNLKHETQQFDNENDMPQDSQSQFESIMIKEENVHTFNQEISFEMEESSEYENVEEFKTSPKLQNVTDKAKMMEELQYSCRKIKVKGVKWEKFSRMTDSLKEMYWIEAQHLIQEQSHELKVLQQKTRRYRTKIENLTIFTRNMKKEIAKRAQAFKI